jgi:hypothetical protein
MSRAKEEGNDDYAVDSTPIVAEWTAVSGLSDREDESAAGGIGGAPPPPPAFATASATDSSRRHGAYSITPACTLPPPGGSVLFVPGDNIHQPRRESNGNGDDGAGAEHHQNYDRTAVAIRIEDAIIEHVPISPLENVEIGHAEPIETVTFCGKELQSSRRSFIMILFSLVILVLASVAMSVSIYFTNNNTPAATEGNIPDQPPSLLDREFATLNDNEKELYYREFALSLSPHAVLSDPNSPHFATLIWLDACVQYMDCASLFDSNKSVLTERYAWNVLWDSTRGGYWSASQDDDTSNMCDWKVDSYQCNDDNRVTAIFLGK